MSLCLWFVITKLQNQLTKLIFKIIVFLIKGLKYTLILDAILENWRVELATKTPKNLGVQYLHKDFEEFVINK